MRFNPFRKKARFKPNTSNEFAKIDTLLPDSKKEKPQEGTVVSADPIKRDEKKKMNPLDILNRNKIQ